MQKGLRKRQENRRTGQDRQAGQAGQGLVEYALVLVLVAVVCIAIMFATGLSVQRVYGLVAGALGAKHNTEDYKGQGIYIDVADCYVISPGDPFYKSQPPFDQGFTGFHISGHAVNVTVDQLSLASDNQMVNAMAQDNQNFKDLGGGAFDFAHTFEIGTVDEGLCPRTVIIQTPNGAIATSPVNMVH